MATSYSFPLFTNGDIAEFFSNKMNPAIRITEADLKNIKAPVALRLYTGIWEAIMDEEVDTVCQPRFDTVDGDHPELHAIISQKATFAMALRWLLSQAGASEFNLMDLQDPKPRRTNMFLSALLNYYLFVCHRIPVWDEMKAQKEEEDEMIGSLKDANEALQRQIDELTQARTSEEPQRAELAKQAEVLESDLNELVLQKHDIVQKVTEKQAELAKVTENEDLRKEQLAAQKEELLAMDAKIIQSPARLTLEIESLVEKKTKARAKQMEFYDRLTEMERKIRYEEKFMKETDGALKIVREFSDLLQKEAKLIDGNADSVAKLADVETRCGELSRQLEALDEEQQNRRQKQQRAVAGKQVRINSLKADIQARESALERLKETASQKQSQHQSCLREIQNFQEEAEEQINEEKQKQELMKSKYAELLETLDKYHTHMASQHRDVTERLTQFMDSTRNSENIGDTSENTPPE